MRGRVFPKSGTIMAIGSDSGGGRKRQRVDDRCEAVASDAVPVYRISTLSDGIFNFLMVFGSETSRRSDPNY